MSFWLHQHTWCANTRCVIHIFNLGMLSLRILSQYLAGNVDLGGRADLGGRS